MTVPVQATYNVSNGNGVATSFACDFVVQLAGDLVVTVAGVTMTYPSGYTITNLGTTTNAIVVFATAPANGAQVVRERILPLSRTAYDYQQSGDFLAAVVNADLDRVWMAMQQLDTANDFALRFPVTVSGFNFELPSPVADYALFSNSANTALEWRSPGSVALAVPADLSVSRAKLTAAMSAGISASISEYGAVGDGVTDDSAAINAAIYAVYLAGGGNLYFPPGTYRIASTLFPRTYVNWIGASSPSYNADAVNATVLKRDASLLKMIYQSAYVWGVSGIEFEGNNGQANASATYCFANTPAGTPLPADDPLRPGTTTYPAGSGCYLHRCTFSNFWYGISDPSSARAYNITECLFRTCISAVMNVSDSRIINCVFSGNTYAGVYLNNGGVHITGNLFEFQRTGTGGDEVAHGIVLQNNSNEIQIDNNRFDRNAGNDIQIFDGTKRPRDITITDNHFMRAGWGTNATYRGAIYLDGADRVTIVGNQFYAANANPSTARGLVSPRYAVVHSACKGLVIKDNQWNNVASKMTLDSSVAGNGNSHSVAPVWIESASGTDEWYLTDWWDTNGNPFIGEPHSVVSDGVLQTAGTAGALSAGEWDWADNDSLGFSTLYCRVTAGGDPGVASVVAYHSNDPVVSQLNNSGMPTRSTDIQTDHYKDAVRYSPAARVLVANNAVASITSNVLSITVADGHGIVAGQTVYLADPVTVSAPAALYVVASVTDAGGGNDYININRTAANAVGTIDIYTVTEVSFILRTRRRGMTNHVTRETLRLSCDQATTTATALAEMPFLISVTTTSAMPTIINGTPSISVGALDVDWRATSSENNLNVALSSDMMGDEITVSIYNTTAYTVEVTAEFPW